MVASVEVGYDYNLPDIIRLSGCYDIKNAKVEKGRLFVSSVTQESLDFAIESYSHADFIAREGKRIRLLEISEQLSRIDAESVRPLRAKVAGNATADDDAKLDVLEAEASALRTELMGMTS